LLHGIPVGIKDMIDVAGMPTKAASSLRATHLAERDATVVTRLRQAGAIILGKTVTTEWACFDPPPTRNPWNLNHTPGGSSSGSAAAVAMRMCMAAIGSQTGGSIIRPASYCGVAGLKPTFAAVPTDGVVPVSRHLDHVGPIARSADDLAMMLAVVYQPRQTRAGLLQKVCPDLASDSRRSGYVDSPLLFLDNCRGFSAQSPNLSVLEEFFLEHVDPQAGSVTRAALARLQTGALARSKIELPRSFGQVHALHRRIMAVDAAAVHREAYAVQPDAFGPQVASLIQVGVATSAVDYAIALEHQSRFQSEVLALFPDDRIVVTPATNATAPDRLDTTGDPKFQSPWSYAGLPTVCIPCGLAANGMPCGLQFVGPPHSDARVLSAAAWTERQLAFDELPPE
jgi:aspartyl-tRNA(Asn)/glutamyl-tRNA(Gln) amidotransferase subunit A